MKPVRVLVVDDSATMRGLITSVLKRDPFIEVVGSASDANQARAAIKDLQPDVMTLDVEMPGMNGLEFLEKVMRLRPFPVVMVSSLTAKGAATAVSAFELGAIECVGKPTAEHPDTFERLAATVRAAASARLSARPAAGGVRTSAAAAPYNSDGRVLAIGASTGGVEALIEVISCMPANCPPTVITLHMPTPFTKSFARRLDGLTPASVTEASEGRAARRRPDLPRAGQPRAFRHLRQRPVALYAAVRRARERPPAVGRRSLQLGRRRLRRPRRRRHPHRHGAGRRKRPADDEEGGRAHARAG